MLVALTGLLWAGPPAAAVLGPPLTVQVTPDGGGPTGARITITGAGATPGRTVRLTLADEQRRALAAPAAPTADQEGAFRAALLLPDGGSARLQVLACQQGPEDEPDQCERQGRAAVEHHGPSALRGESGHERVTLHLQHLADPASCGPAVVRRGSEPVASVEPQQGPDGRWQGRLVLEVPGGRWAFSAAQTSDGCAVRTPTVTVAAYDVWTEPERPEAGERLVVHGAAFEQGCPALDVALDGQPLGTADPDDEGGFALEATAPAQPGSYRLLVTRPASELCARELRLAEVVDVVPVSSPTPSGSAGPTSTASAFPTGTGTTPTAAPSTPSTSPTAVPASQPSLSVGAAPPPGGPLAVTGAGWLPGEDVLLALDGQPVVQLPARADGTVATTVRLPDEAGGTHRLSACQRCDSPSPLLAGVAFEVPLQQRGPHPALALLLLLPAAAVPAYRERQRRVVRRVSLAPRPPGQPLPRLLPPSGPPGHAVRLVPRSTPPTVHLREALP